jgi:hypothetical protein
MSEGKADNEGLDLRSRVNMGRATDPTTIGCHGVRPAILRFSLSSGQLGGCEDVTGSGLGGQACYIAILTDLLGKLFLNISDESFQLF